ncbi:hypothetical protein OG900_14555 [Streptomyces sp. NBC_00433]
MNDITGGRTAADQDPVSAAVDGFDGFGTSDLLGLPGMDRMAAARTVAPPAADVTARAEAVVTAAVQRAQLAGADIALDDAPGAAVPVRRRFFRRRWIASAALVAAAATGVAVLPAVDLGGGSAASASAADFLKGVADRSAEQPWKGTPEAWEVVSDQWVVGYGAGYHDEIHFEHGTEVERSRGARTMTYSGYDKYGPGWFAGEDLVDWNHLNSLPTDVTALTARLTGGISAGQAFDNIGSMLATSPAKPQLRAALFRVLAGLDGVRLDGAGKDSLGREGTEVSASHDHVTFRLLVEPATGTLLEEAQVGEADVPAYTNCPRPPMPKPGSTYTSQVPPMPDPKRPPILRGSGSVTCPLPATKAGDLLAVETYVSAKPVRLPDRLRGIPSTPRPAQR